MAESKLLREDAGEKRGWKTVTKQDIENILEQKDPLNTKKKLWMSCFSEYLHDKNLPESESISEENLPDILEMFYSEVQKKSKSRQKENVADEQTYKNSTMQTLRAGIARFYRDKKGFDGMVEKP